MEGIAQDEDPMSIAFEILGPAGRDNALLVRIDTGQGITRLLFDCGDGCLSGLKISEIRAVDHLFFSHLHMDHVGGFDSFFRCTFNRDSKANIVWGPPATARIMHHRFRGFMWNLHKDLFGTWRVNDVFPDRVESCRFQAAEAFAWRHDEGSQRADTTIVNEPGFIVDAFQMNHKTPSLAYIVREKPRLNIHIERLSALGLPQGPWLKDLKEQKPDDLLIEINGKRHRLGDLRDDLFMETPGDSIAYVTDFLMDESAREMLSSALKGCNTVVCEAQYGHNDLELAKRNFHMTTKQAAQLAGQAEIGQLVLFHLSERYRPDQWQDMLKEAKEIFPDTCFPGHFELTPTLHKI